MDNGIIINEHLLASKDKCDSLGVCTKRPKFPSYALRTKREESFKHWPDYLRLDKHDLIDAGLVYTGVGDSVRCYHCGGGLRNWESGDKPMLEHAKWYPDCTHVLLVKGRQYIDAAGRGEDLDVLRSIKAGYEDKKSKVDYHPDLKCIAAQSCLEMGYTVQDVQNAMKTFQITQGVGDSVRCYHCGGGLRNWESGDKPMLEHAKWYPDCTHVLLVKGRQYIDAAGRGEDLDVLRSIKAGYEDKKSKVDYHPDLKCIAAQSCLEMGYTVQDVQNAMKTFQITQGHTNFKAVDLLSLILDNEHTDTLTDGACYYNTDDSVLAQESDQENEDEIQRMFEENQRIKENQTCKICLEEMAAIIFLPCGHFVSCPQCCVALVKCPVCRIEVKGQVRAQFA